ncbi:polysaccharide deacetylase family protein [Actinomadura opuntiae]|uniref:polysaccharide deacetylase family protein n=1 Tax=Actinomadura sp. OS1-43 TaxID=604315 RepID=UPI00255A82BB|nr:polysaccharide deacetylase family protein [Actinomadura sp. OS1-43]MDL4813570.1 polysaccharide deacetylase family protein [Actinomadura sp. OS1-43]
MGDLWGRSVRVVAGAAVLALLLAGCQKAASEKPAKEKRQVAAPAVRQRQPDTAAVWRKWGLEPMAPAPAPPADKPLKLPKKGPAKVFQNVPTTDKVVFVTLDDGQEKDPKFVEMMNDLKVPVTMFLTKDDVQDDYGYFKPLQALGNRIQDHTITHPVLPGLGPEGQKHEICGDRDALVQQYGTAPTLLRPPFGRWNSLTQEAARECGISGIVMWVASMQIHDFQYDDPNKELHPGDILLAHFRGREQLRGESMTQMFAHLLKQIQKRGFSVGRLEDYISVQ